MLGDTLLVGHQAVQHTLVIFLITITNRLLLSQIFFGLLKITLLGRQLLLKNPPPIGITRLLGILLNTWETRR